MNQEGKDSNGKQVVTMVGPLDPREEPETVVSTDYATVYGEELAQTLDLGTWQPGEDLFRLYERLESEIGEAVRQEDEMRARIRQIVFPQLCNREGAPPNAGVYKTTVAEIERIHRGYLFNGAVEACDGNCILYDTLPLTIIQLGVSLVSYQGEQGAWVHRLYRRDLRISGGDPVEETLDLLEHRRHRAAYDHESKRDILTNLGRRGIMAYVERAVLLKRSISTWRMGHGNPVPYELITGSGMVELVERSLELLEELVIGHQRFVFVPSAPADRMLLTIGNALRPMEYAIVDTIEESLNRILSGHYRGSWKRLIPKLERFVREVGSKIVVGLYRATPIASAQLFYAHVDHAHKAAHIVLADSVLQEHRGYPMLISLADTVCSAALGTESLVPHVQLAYTEADAPYRYQTERQTRR